MATLTAEERQRIRNACEAKASAAGVPITWVKGGLNDAAQAVETVLSSTALSNQISTAIDNATAAYGITFTANQKKWIVSLVLQAKYVRDF